ncbi:S-adenosyl-L-methionine-dependent methyltransferase [Mycena belliarum]|uniref:S-adenosyl-L-methionine-dependent methyltransferase n=1 Tax=Mycena belliarum TaxID=1033014 RepID=A0AAD6U4M4_9AGAR|nr:S-adenosyl-L-methionine-dependent methyltransferase [Mycena belliae]
MVQIISEDSGQISSLLGLIKEAATTLEAGYAKGPGGVPCLDDTAPHPLDRNISTPEMREATQVLEGACAQLCAVLARPNHTVLNNFFLTALQPSCLRIALEFNIPDILQHKPSGMHVAEISKICGVDASKLARILRLLTAKHCFREVEKDVFANNRLSVQLLTSNPLYSLGLHMTEDMTQAATKLAETLADAEWGPSVIPTHAAFNKFTSQPLAMFDFWAQTPAMHEHGERFGVAMIGWGTAVEAEAVVSAYHWHTLPPGATVCDLGGGVGALSMQLARAHPTLHIALQDLPERMVQAAQTVWPAACPEALAEGRVNFRAIDFFKEVPLAGCDVYYVGGLLKNILHAFQEAQCITILKGVRQAMKRGSRVLIHEYILQMAAAAASSSYSAQNKQLARAPAPLLSNYGAGRIRQYYLDVSLMVLINSKERTLEEYVALGEAAGLRFVRVWAFGDMSGVELCASEEGED